MKVYPGSGKGWIFKPNRTTREKLYLSGWVPFMVVAMLVAIAGNAVVRLNRKNMEQHIWAHLKLILDGSPSLLQTQFFGD
jgi:hypothetical protein